MKHKEQHATSKKRVFGFLFIIIGVIFIIAGCGSSPDKVQVTSVKQPLTASQIASHLNCLNFKDTGPAALYAVDTGTCTRDGVKYAIDTFATTAIRDRWLKVAENYGVVPKWETATSVIYKSTRS